MLSVLRFRQGAALRPSFTRVALVPAPRARATPRQGPGKTACNEHVSAHLPAAIGKVRGRCLPCVSMATGIHSRRRCGGGGPTSGTTTEGIQKWLPTSATCSDNKYYEVAAKWATSSTAGRRRALRQRGQRGPDRGTAVQRRRQAARAPRGAAGERMDQHLAVRQGPAGTGGLRRRIAYRNVQQSEPLSRSSATRAERHRVFAHLFRFWRSSAFPMDGGRYALFEEPVLRSII